MFYYFGRKGRLANTYEAPLYDVVIEPFAGSLAYSMHHRPKLALGFEADHRVVDLWHRLCSMTLREIRSMRPPEVGEQTSDLYWMSGFASNSSLMTSYRTVNDFIYERLARLPALTAACHPYASRHVHYEWADYTDAPDIECTWFIDPPYQDLVGYKERIVDYEALAEWCLTRRGQVIVCEGEFGAWLNFRHHGKRMWGIGNGTTAKRGLQEKIWTSPINVCRCGARFRPIRASHRFCSDRCRVAGWRNATA